MIRSMTGYGAASSASEVLRAAVTARALNHRFLEVVCHMPRRLTSVEHELRELVARRLTRGRIEVTVQAHGGAPAATPVVVSRPLVSALVHALRDLQAEFGLEGGVTVTDVVRFPGAVEVPEELASADPEMKALILALAEEALVALVAMRTAEGARLHQDLSSSLGAIEASAGRIERLSSEGREAKRGLLVERLRALQIDLGLDEARLLAEIARAVERHDVAEEVQRLRSHVAMARELMATEASCGKRLDFLAQELMREANTVGSKSVVAALTQEVVGLKSDIERFREQVQNVE
ncbi:MAG TPA: YicC/YloC family endoribonuclease [Vicinamibacteria bacterium]